MTPAELDETTDHNRQLISDHTKRLRVLERQAAKYGELAVPSHIVIEISQIQEKIDQLNTSYQDADQKSSSEQRIDRKEITPIRRKNILRVVLLMLVIGGLLLVIMYFGKNQNSKDVVTQSDINVFVNPTRTYVPTSVAGGMTIESQGDGNTNIQAGHDVVINPNPTDISVEEAIRIEAGISSKMYLVNHNNIPEEPIEQFLKENEVEFVSPSVFIQVTSQSRDEWIKIPPYLIVDIVKVESLKGLENVLLPEGAGGVSYYHTFYGYFTSFQPKLTGAPHSPGFEGKDEHDDPVKTIFTLSSGEVETFELFGNFESGFRYYFRVGILYSYKGHQEVKWTKVFTAVQPHNSASMWNYNTDDKKIRKMQGEEFGANDATQLKDGIEQNATFVQDVPLFEFPSP